MKYLTYFLTFFAYVAIHTMRMSYSFVKPSFEKEFHLDHLFLGLFDGLVYLSLGIGFFMRYLLEGKMAPTLAYLVFGSIASVGYCIIPVLSLADENKISIESSFILQYGLPGLGLIMFGFCQFSAWPVLLFLVNQHFDIEKEGTIMGVWSANGDIGNITGFLAANLILHQFEMRWEIAMLFAAGVNLALAACVFLFLKSRPKDGEKVEEKTGVEKFKTFLGYSREIIAKHEYKMYLLSMGLLKSILYGFLLWIPTFLSHRGLGEYSGWLPILFNLCTVVGSAALGYFYEESKHKDSEDTDKQFLNCLHIHMRSYSLFYSCLIICLCFGVFYSVAQEIVGDLILAGVIGFFLGGTFNMLAGNEVMAITNGDKDKVGMLSTLSMSIGNIIVGIVEIIIGVVLNVKEDPEGENKLFIVLLAVGALAALVIFGRSFMHFKRMKEGSLLDKRSLLEGKETTDELCVARDEIFDVND